MAGKLGLVMVFPSLLTLGPRPPKTLGLEVIGPEKKPYTKIDKPQQVFGRARCIQGGAPTSYKWSYNPFKKGWGPPVTYLIIRPFIIGVIRV